MVLHASDLGAILQGADFPGVERRHRCAVDPSDDERQEPVGPLVAGREPVVTVHQTLLLVEDDRLPVQHPGSRGYVAPVDWHRDGADGAVALGRRRREVAACILGLDFFDAGADAVPLQGGDVFQVLMGKAQNAAGLRPAGVSLERGRGPFIKLCFSFNL